MISLPDEEVEVFEAFKNWLYTRNLPASPETTFEEMKVDETKFEEMKVYYTLVCKLWCLGDRREIPLLQNHCINSLIASMRATTTFPARHISYIYDNTVSKAPLRRLVIFAATMLDGSCFEGFEHFWTKDSLLDLTKQLLLRKRAPTWDEIISKTCKWHIHEEGVKCKK